MKISLEEIEKVLDELSTAVIYVKEAKHTAKKVYGQDSEVAFDLKHAYERIQAAVKILEMRGE